MAVIAIAVVACVNILITAAQRNANTNNVCQGNLMQIRLSTVITYSIKSTCLNKNVCEEVLAFFEKHSLLRNAFIKVGYKSKTIIKTNESI